jgi:plasmid stabilization system protein ParE
MQALKVQVKNGRLVLDEPTDLPDGAEIEVIVLDDELSAQERAENRDAKELFVEEFERALEQLSTMPGIGQRDRLARGKLIQRVLMKKTGCHVHYFTTANTIS